MESVRPLSERIEWRLGNYDQDYLTLDRMDAATVVDCPLGWSVRIFPVDEGRCFGRKFDRQKTRPCERLRIGSKGSISCRGIRACVVTPHRSRRTLTRSAASALSHATRQRAPTRNVFDMNEMIYVRLQRDFIQMQQFQRLLQRQATSSY